MVKSAPLTNTVAEGGWGSVEFVVRENGNCPGKDFLDELGDRYVGKKAENITARAKFMVLFQQMANVGGLSKSRFGFEPKHLYSFKHVVRNVQIRFPCFEDGAKWIITHGFDKPGAKKGRGRWPATEVERACNLREEYYYRKEKHGQR